MIRQLAVAGARRGAAGCQPLRGQRTEHEVDFDGVRRDRGIRRAIREVIPVNGRLAGAAMELEPLPGLLDDDKVAGERFGREFGGRVRVGRIMLQEFANASFAEPGGGTHPKLRRARLGHANRKNEFLGPVPPREQRHVDLPTLCECVSWTVR